MCAKPRRHLGERKSMPNTTDLRPFVLPQAFHIHYKDVDPQHEALVDIINDCAERLEDGELSDFGPLFSEFFDRVSRHFDYEEEQMAVLGYVGLDWHKEHHQECLERVRSLIDTMRDRGYACLQDLQVCFHDILHDIARADLKFGEFLDEQRLRES
jgi:hemerythrin-like metal-binding protein